MGLAGWSEGVRRSGGVWRLSAAVLVFVALAGAGVSWSVFRWKAESEADYQRSCDPVALRAAVDYLQSGVPQLTFGRYSHGDCGASGYAYVEWQHPSASQLVSYATRLGCTPAPRSTWGRGDEVIQCAFRGRTIALFVDQIYSDDSVVGVMNYVS